MTATRRMETPYVRRRRIPRRIGSALAALLMLCFVLGWVYPFLWMVSASFKTPIEMFAAGLDLLPKEFDFSNYVSAWTTAGFGHYLINTIIVTVASVLVIVIRCAMAGYVLARFSFLGKRVLMGVLVATLLVPSGFTIIPIVQLAGSLHLLNSLWGMILALSGGANVASILLYIGFFRSVPRELEEAARIDGAGFMRTFFRVMFPLARPVTATVGLLTFLGTWNTFLLPLVFTFSRPDLRTVSVGMLAFVGENSTDWSGMAAAATISLLPVVILFLILQRFFVNGIAGAVKS